MMTLLSRRGRVCVAAVGIAAVAILIAGALLAPVRTADAYLVAYVAALSVALGALALVMIAHLTNANWFVTLRPIAERIMDILPVLAVLGLPLIVAVHVLYPWSVSTGAASPDMRAAIGVKAAYLNTPFFVVRWVIYWVTWIGTAALLRRRPSAVAGESPTSRIARYQGVSAAGLVVLAFTMTFASFDWIMSLTPAWYSTIFGVYWFAGGVLGALALIAVVMCLTARGPTSGPVASDQLHAVGTLMFTFTMLWAYMGYAQLLIIWSADLPAEVGWYVDRSAGGWRVLAALLVVGHFALPFLLLLLRAVKRNASRLAWLGGWLLLMHYADSYWLVMPGIVRAVWWGWALDLAALVAVVLIATGVATMRAKAASVPAATLARPDPTAR